mmetsp:Transcript_34688/g.98295  ORF Transcript_34688/g.98295 Transcript_34688/m.98295 type:complete len:106 (+) Transcript_34688:832-1149(+)
MELALDRPGLVSYVVSNFTASGEDIDSGSAGANFQVGNGRVVVLNNDPADTSVTVNITACVPSVLEPGSDYLVQVVARDKHGRTEGRVRRRITATAFPSDSLQAP